MEARKRKIYRDNHRYGKWIPVKKLLYNSSELLFDDNTDNIIFYEIRNCTGTEFDFYDETLTRYYITELKKFIKLLNEYTRKEKSQTKRIIFSKTKYELLSACSLLEYKFESRIMGELFNSEKSALFFAKEIFRELKLHDLTDTYINILKCLDGAHDFIRERARALKTIKKEG